MEEEGRWPLRIELSRHQRPRVLGTIDLSGHQPTYPCDFVPSSLSHIATLWHICKVDATNVEGAGT